MDRRSFIANMATFSGSLAVACTSLGRRSEAFNGSGDGADLHAEGYGELLPTPSANTGETFLTLPHGFEYKVIGRVGDKMYDGRLTPRAHDGMRTFKVGRELRIVRNHEISDRKLPKEGSAIGSKFHYDETAGGGTTTLVIDPKTRTVVRDFVSLSGTLINCAGGSTPWGSWISCEETTLGKTVRTLANGGKQGGYNKPHGYCFEVPAAANGEVKPVPLKAMGRFEHEAVGVDPKTGIVYLTEDFASCGLYRFIPRKNKRLAEGGSLQMLAVTGNAEYDTRRSQKVGSVLSAHWVTIDNPDPEEADVDPSAVFKQGRAKGGAVFARLEGCETDSKGRVFVTATSGGDTKGGQIWRYEPDGRDKGHLTLLFESPAREILHMPDNICKVPHSDLLMICEDSDYVGQAGVNHLRILTPDGRIANFSQNVSTAFPRSEFAGSTFSPDGKTLFVNLQLAGATFAIWGDWSKFRS